MYLGDADGSCRPATETVATNSDAECANHGGENGRSRTADRQEFFAISDFLSLFAQINKLTLAACDS